MIPVPKPPRREKRPRKPLPPSSHPIPRGTRPKAINAKRRNREWIRSYGSAERVAFVAALPCIVCGHVPCENAHYKGGGAGRKADANTIVPLCKLHHAEQHHFGVETFGARHHLDLPALAEETERVWQSTINSSRSDSSGRRASGRDGE